METSSLTSISSSASSPQPAERILSSPSKPKATGDPPPLYREVRRLPNELCEHPVIYFEEGLYIAGLNLLISLLVSGNTPNARTPAFLPPPQHLALAATLIVHPVLTTRAKSEELIEAANLALRYLRLVLKIVGPVNGRLREAFVFTGVGTSSRRGGSGRRRTTGEEVSSVDEHETSINSDLAQAAAVWSRAEDFWNVVGWAFHCSVLHKKRWERWSVWLEYMVQVLETDWNLRGCESVLAEPENKKEDAQEYSLIMKYLSSESSATGRDKRILRAIFADGSSKSASEFTEIWRNETKERKKDAGIRKVETKIDIEADNWGDYMDEDGDSALESEDESALPFNTESPHSKKSASIPNVADPLGGMDAIVLRLRLLALLSAVSFALPNTFTRLGTLYDLYLDHIRPFPLPTFFLIISPSSLRLFEPAAASSLTQYILRSLIASNATLPTKDELSQDVMEQSYLPYAANTGSIADNAKVSLCLETLLRLLDKHIGLVWTERLQNAMEEGIETRKRKAKKIGKKGGNGDGERMWLEGSAGRIRGVVEMARQEELTKT